MNNKLDYMRRIGIITFLTFTFFSISMIPKKSNTQLIVENVAGQILNNTAYGFINTQTNESFNSSKELASTENIDFISPYIDWHYWNGVLNIAMIDLYEITKNEQYKNFSLNNYQFAFDNFEYFKKNYDNTNRWDFPYGQLFLTQELDDCGAIGGGLIDAYKLDKQKRYKKYIDNAADHILNKQQRLEDGTLVRKFPHEMTLWADDLYMSIVFLARMGELTGDKKYFNDAALQVKNFTKYLYNETTELYYHCYYSDLKRNGVAHWGRCNGWVMMAQAELLDHLPENHPQRKELLEIFTQQVIGISRYQSKNGLWHQILNKQDSYLETSGSAMFTYSIAKAINKGWIDKRYVTIAENGWKGISSKIQADGQVQDICVGTGIRDDMIFYYERPTLLNDIHGLGAVLLAGIEIMKLESTK